MLSETQVQSQVHQVPVKCCSVPPNGCKTASENGAFVLEWRLFAHVQVFPGNGQYQGN